MSPPTSHTPDSWAASVMRWSRMAGWPAALSALLSLFTLVGLSLLYRELPVIEAGLLALVISLSDILGLIALHGLGTTITRLYAGSKPGVFDWTLDLLTSAGYAVPIVALGSLGSLMIYALPSSATLYLLVLTSLGALLAAAYSMLNSQGHYAWSAFLVRLPNAALFLPGALGLAGLAILNLSAVLLVYVLATAASLALAIVLLRRFLPRGGRKITRKERYEGLAFMATSATDLLPDQGLVAIAAKVLPLPQVAAFAAVAVLLRPFRLLRSVLTMILAPDLLRFRRVSYRRLISGIWMFALGCGLAAAVLGPPLASRFYAGRYQEGLAWIPYLALAGVLLIGLVPPRSDLGARAPIQTMNRFAVTYLLVMLASLAASLAGMLLFAGASLGVAAVLLQVTGTGLAYVFWLGFRRRENGSNRSEARAR